MSENSYERTLSAELERQRKAHEAAVEVALARLADDPYCKRDLAKRQRTIRAVVDAELDPTRPKDSAFKEQGVISRSTFYSLKSRWNSYPPFKAVLDEVLRLEREWEQKRDGREREARRLAHKERMLGIASKMLERAESMMQFPLSKQVIDSETGQVIIMPAGWHYGSLGTTVATADKVARTALEMETERTASTVEVIVPDMDAALDAIYGSSADGD